MDERSKRNALIVGAIALALLSIVAGALIALSDDDEPAAAASPTPSATPAQTSSRARRPSPTETPGAIRVASRRSSRTATTSCT